VSAYFISGQTLEKNRKRAGCGVLLIFLVFISVGSCGCIKLMQQSEVNSSTQTMTVLHPDPVRTIAPVASLGPSQKISPATPAPSAAAAAPDLVTDAAPILPPDPYPIQHGTRINATPINNSMNRVPDFSRTYAFDGNATGMIINVTKGPLIISFVVNPLNDCLEDPDSCRGKVIESENTLDGVNSFNRPFFTLTVRDNQTHEIVAEDGYGREYSSDTGSYDYSKSITSTDPHYTEHSTTTVKVTTIPRHITIYKEGTYHVTLTGAYLDVTLSVATGASPLASDTQSSSAGPAPTKTMSPEYLRYLKQTGRAP